MREGQIGRYEVLGRLGQGGMGDVLLGRDTVLRRLVAIKVVHAHLLAGPQGQQLRAYFHREAQTVAGLKHPNIVEVYDYSGPVSEDTYLVTEYIDGITLRDLVAHQGRLLEREAVALLSEVSDALSCAHAASVVHRDLKPANVMLGRDGRVVLVDFGIAKPLGTGLFDGNLTQTTRLIGSPNYMAPEQVELRPVDPRTDLFAFGVMAYELVTGCLPFADTHPLRLFQNIIEARYKDPREQVADLSPEYHGLIRECLQADPNDRLPSATAAQEILERRMEALGIRSSRREIRAALPRWQGAFDVAHTIRQAEDGFRRDVASGMTTARGTGDSSDPALADTVAEGKTQGGAAGAQSRRSPDPAGTGPQVGRARPRRWRGLAIASGLLAAIAIAAVALWEQVRPPAFPAEPSGETSATAGPAEVAPERPAEPAAPGPEPERREAAAVAAPPSRTDAMRREAEQTGLVAERGAPETVAAILMAKPPDGATATVPKGGRRSGADAAARTSQAPPGREGPGAREGRNAGGTSKPAEPQPQVAAAERSQEPDERKHRLVEAVQGGVRAFQKGDLDRAVALCRVALELDPQNWDCKGLISRTGEVRDLLAEGRRAADRGDADACRTLAARVRKINSKAEGLAALESRCAGP